MRAITIDYKDAQIFNLRSEGEQLKPGVQVRVR